MVKGSCHCGTLRWTFRTDLDPSEWVIRACQCSFCRIHQARCTSDPNGAVAFSTTDSAAVCRYRFEMSTADFLLCGKCGAYLGAMIDGPDGGFATLNLNCMDSMVRNLRGAVPVSYDSEERRQRIERRRSKWTPVIAGI